MWSQIGPSTLPPAKGKGRHSCYASDFAAEIGWEIT